ncbi:hypothetical protein PV328_010254 [Microctonus aethiopoides]|uniref:J domain-containing protein n=1 Tax=Microctonus aethiopoides TaxID=144406 RepID=A0AA39C7I8_9HYME|nr:hypothetical protein PV328_010254 [Microctonus aethiopoides]
MMNRSRISWLNVIYRNMSTSRRDTVKKNHYDSLEIKTKATHNEIKSAYFKLSKQYHPDMNSSDEAKVKFNDISTAYEILGNHEKRKQYDRGLQITSMIHEGPDIIVMRKTDIADITEEAKRVQSEMNRVRTQADGSPIYNFDSWAEEHYGRVFERRQKDLSDMKFHENRRENEMKGRLDARHDLSIFAVFMSIIFLIISIKMQYFENLDIPITTLNEEKLKDNDDFTVVKRKS